MEVRPTVHKEDTTTFPDYLLFMAMEDLDASVVLYDAGHYPQSVFLLQQAVEKAAKSLGFFFQIITEKEAVNFVRHQPLNIVKKTHNKFADYINKANKSAQNIPELKARLTAIGLDPSKLEKAIKPMTHTIGEYLRKSEIYDPTENEIQNIIADLNDKSTLLDLVIQKNLDEGIQEKDYRELKEQLTTAYTDSIVSQDISEAQKTEWLQNLQDSLPEIIPSKEQLEYLVLIMIACFEAVYVLFQLARITASHAERARYPDPKTAFDPLCYYTSDRPIVAALPELHSYTGIALERLDYLYELIESAEGAIKSMFGSCSENATMLDPSAIPSVHQEGHP